MSARAKRITGTVLLVLATLLWTAGMVAVWAQRQMLDTKNWVDTSGRMLENPEIRTAVSQALLQRLYAGHPVQDKLEQELPPPLDKLAAPISAGLRQVADRNAPKVLGSAAFLTAWKATNRNAHKALLALLAGKAVPRDTVSLDAGQLLRQLADQSGLPPGTVDRLPAAAQQIQIIKGDQLQAARDALDTFKKLTIVFVVLAVLLFAGAVALWPDRRRAAVLVGACILFAGLLVIAIRAVGDDSIAHSLAKSADAAPAVKAALVIGTSLLVDAAEGSALAGLFLVVGAWFGGPGRRATRLREAAAPALRDHIGVVRFGLGVLLLLLVIWGPVPWTRTPWAILVVAIAAFAWLEWLRSRERQGSVAVP